MTKHLLNRLRRLASDNAGSSLVSTLMVGAISSIMTLAVTTMILKQQNTQEEILFKNNVIEIRDSLISAIASDTAWSQTRTNNGVMNCISDTQNFCKPGSSDRSPIVLYDGGGQVIYDSANPTSGYRLNGTPCNAFSAAGNDQCPLRAVVGWRAVCHSGNCSSRSEYVSVSFEYKPLSKEKKFPFNPANYEVSEQSRGSFGGAISPILACANLGMIFIGKNNTFNGHTADPDGCVPYVAFQGPAGVDGPAGVAGTNASCPK